ncbi:hypothetical protein BJX63DRAFT_394027 [Aspergillus granulosus]|uniref:Uncharacterized protein n=1 Tax=Aspergillus granulosus TaxID=176169 RepID=A0ABR4HFK3_9EURO
MGKKKKLQKQLEADNSPDPLPASSPFTHVDQKLSRLRDCPTVPLEMTFYIDWELHEFVCTQLNGLWDSLGELTTVDGPPGQTEITTCKQYLIRHWGYDGIGILARVAECYANKKSMPHKTHLGVRYNIEHGERFEAAAPELIFNAKGKPNDLINMAKMLSWLTGTFKMPKEGEPTYSYSEPSVSLHTSCKPYCAIAPNWKYNWEFGWRYRLNLLGPQYFFP